MQPQSSKSPREEKETKEIVSRPGTLEMIEYRPESFAGINHTFDMVIFFNGNPITEFTGDQETRKTSNLRCIEALLAGEMPSNSINREDNNRKAELTFRKGDIKLQARFTKTGFSVTQFLDLGDGKTEKRLDVKEPKSFLRDLIGPVIKNPQALQEMNGKEQIEWIRKLIKNDTAILQKELEYKQAYKDAYNKRTDLNREMKRIRMSLSGSHLYRWDTNNKTFVEAADFNKLQEMYAKDETHMAQELDTRYAEIQGRRDKVISAKKGLENLREQKRENEGVIERLKRELEAAERESERLKERITSGEIYLEENKNVEEEMAAIMKEKDTLASFKLDKHKFKETVKEKESYETYEQEWINVSSALEQYSTLLQEVVKALTPEIEGVEICIPKNIDVVLEEEIYRSANPDATDKDVKKHLDKMQQEVREGIFYGGNALNELSESQMWTFWLQLSAELKSQVAIIENLTSLGSGAVEQINKFVTEQNGVVFYSAMQRGLKELKVRFHRQIEG